MGHVDRTDVVCATACILVAVVMCITTPVAAMSTLEIVTTGTEGSVAANGVPVMPDGTGVLHNDESFALNSICESSD